MRWSWWMGVVLAMTALTACSKGKTDMFSKDQAKKAAQAVLSELGDGAEAAKVEITGTTVRIRAADPKSAGQLVDYLYADGKLGKPQTASPVSGKAAGNLFPLAGVDFDLVPVLAGEAQAKVGRPVKELRLMHQVLRSEKIPPSWFIETYGDGLAVASMDGKELKVEKAAH